MRTTELARLALAACLAAAPLGAAFAQGGFSLGGGGEPVEIESDKLEVLDRENVAIFTGNVVLIQGDLLLKTIKLTVHYTEAATDAAGAQPAGGGGTMGGGTEVERMIAEGKVFLDQRGQVVTGDRGEFEMKKGMMVVTGNEVVLTEGSNVVVGCRFTMNTESGRSQVDACPNSAGAGRVRMLLQSGSAQP